MKRIILLLTILSTFTSLKAQTMEELKKRIKEIEDRTALKNVVDVFSILADQKDTQKQTLLFTEDAVSETYVNGQIVSTLKGRKQIGDAFAAYLSLFETVYHMNGQQTVVINGEKATGTSYCLVTLIGVENGKKWKTNIGAYYEDEFTRHNGQWLIAHRKATFAWQEKLPVNQ